MFIKITLGIWLKWFLNPTSRNSDSVGLEWWRICIFTKYSRYCWCRSCKFYLWKPVCRGRISKSESLTLSLRALLWWVTQSLGLSLPIYKMGIMIIPTCLSVMWELNMVIHAKHLICFWHIANARLMLTIIILMRS